MFACPPLAQVLTSLSFLHSLGLVHADLKPENILVKSYSRCQVKASAAGGTRRVWGQLPLALCPAVHMALAPLLNTFHALGVTNRDDKVCLRLGGCAPDAPLNTSPPCRLSTWAAPATCQTTCPRMCR